MVLVTKPRNTLAWDQGIVTISTQIALTRPAIEVGRMYLLLLVFGAVLGAAGVVLALSGVSLRDGTFDAAILTPGIVAAVGGLLLIGLGVGLRTLQRIEQALAVRPMPRAHPLSEIKLAELADASRQTPAIPFAPKASRQPLPGVTSMEWFT